MASSQLKSERPAEEAAAGGFPFAWRSPVISGSETVITNLRVEPPVAFPQTPENQGRPDLLRRLFPTGEDTDDAHGICLGHFTIQRRIGIGGMGSVFLATDERLRRNVALKVLSPTITSDPAAVLRFQNEAIAAARLDHDNIARIFYYGEDCGLHYIAYEYIPGSNLRDVIRSKERLAPAEAVNYTMQLAAALSHTAAAGVIHRDIKPSNVLITPQGRAKLVDLGLARKESADSSLELTVAGTTLGTFDYISPEQAKDPRSVDVRSDIYSLGCTLYHMLTGEPPYPEGTVLQKLLDHQGKDAPDPARKNRRVPPALSIIVRKMMESEPRRRYSTPGKLLSDLLQVARQLGTGAVPIDGQVWLTATQPDHQPWQGNIGWVAAAAALLLLVIAMEQFPGLTHRIDPHVKSAQSSSIVSASKSSETLTASVDTPQSPSANTSRIATGEPEANWTSKSLPSVIPQPSSIGRAARDTTSSDFSPPKEMFEGVPTLVAPMLGEPKSLIALPANPTAPITSVPTTTSGTVDTAPETSTPPRPVSSVATSIVAVPGGAEQRNVISIVGGKSYPTLEAACSEARDGSEIELRYNGRLGNLERPFRLSKKGQVRIQGAYGYRPIIEFAPKELQTDENQSRMIIVTGGSLELVDVDLVLTIPDQITADRWAMFKLERPKDLQLRNVTITVNNPSVQPACVIEQVAAPGQGVGNVGMMKNGMPLDPPRVSISKCVFRGQCDLIMLRDAVPVHFQLENSVVAVQGVLFRAICQTEFTGSENDRVSLDLDHTTCLTSEGLVITEGIDNQTDHTPPITVNARGNIFWCEPNRSLVAMFDASEVMDIQRRFNWIGDRNHYDSIGAFWQLGGRQGSAFAQLFDYDRWRSSRWGTNEGASSVNSAVLWKNGSPEGVGARTELRSMELEPGSSSAAEGRGATIKNLPVPPLPDGIPLGSEQKRSD